MPERDLLNSIYYKYPALRNLGEVVLKADPEFTKDKTGVGDIEHFGTDPTHAQVTYDNGFVYPHPKVGTEAVVYNPNTNNEQNIALDMLHGMPNSDPKYKEIRGNLSSAYQKSRFNDEFERDYKNGEGGAGRSDGKGQAWENWIDGQIRGLMFEGKDEDFEKQRYWKDARSVYLQDPDIKKSFNRLQSYITTGADMSPNDNYNEDINPTEAQPVESPNVTAPQAGTLPAGVSQADKLMQQLFAIREPKPVFDQAKADRLQKMGRINQLGKGIGVLGDMLSLGLGANVRQRRPDTTSPALYQAYQNLLDQNKAANDNWAIRDTQNQKQNIGIAFNEEHRKEQEALRQQQLKNQLEIAQQKNDFDRIKYIQDQINKGLDRDLKAKTSARSQSIQIDRNNISREKAATTAKQEKPFDAIEVKDVNNNNVKLSQGDWDNLYQEAMKDENFTKNNLPALQSMFKNTPDAGLKQIARSYYDYKKGNKPVDNAFAPYVYPKYTTPGTGNQNTPKAAQEPTKKPSYSTGGYY